MRHGGALAPIRKNVAAALAFSTRKYWGRTDLTMQDKVVVDLLVEALQRIGYLVQPSTAGLRNPADLIEDQALPQVRQQCKLLAAVASRPPPGATSLCPMPPGCMGAVWAEELELFRSTLYAQPVHAQVGEAGQDEQCRAGLDLQARTTAFMCHWEGDEPGFHLEATELPHSMGHVSGKFGMDAASHLTSDDDSSLLQEEVLSTSSEVGIVVPVDVVESSFLTDETLGGATEAIETAEQVVKNSIVGEIINSGREGHTAASSPAQDVMWCDRCAEPVVAETTTRAEEYDCDFCKRRVGKLAGFLSASFLYCEDCDRVRCERCCLLAADDLQLERLFTEYSMGEYLLGGGTCARADDESKPIGSPKDMEPVRIRLVDILWRNR